MAYAGYFIPDTQSSVCLGNANDQMDAPYNSQGVPLSQLRKLQLSEDDRALMNKVKTQGKSSLQFTKTKTVY